MNINFSDLPDETFSIAAGQAGIGPELAKTSTAMNRAMEETAKTCLDELQHYTEEHRESYFLIGALKVSKSTTSSIQRIGQIYHYLIDYGYSPKIEAFKTFASGPILSAIDEAIQEQEDKALETIFPTLVEAVEKVAGRIPQSDSLPKIARECRKWLHENNDDVKKVGSLTFEKQKLTQLPREIGEFKGLRILHLEENELRTLPIEIGELTALEGLNLRGNQIKSLPAEIGELTTLYRLNLSHNQLKSLPPEIGKLKVLVNFDLENNQLETLPTEIEGLIGLKELFLDDNQLVALPSEIGTLIRLNDLRLKNNRIQNLPIEIKGLVALDSLDLGYNHLEAIPDEIGALTPLRFLFLDGNPLKTLPPEIDGLMTLERLYLERSLFENLPPKTLDGLIARGCNIVLKNTQTLHQKLDLG